MRKIKTNGFGLIEMSYLLLLFSIIIVSTVALVNFAENSVPRQYIHSEQKLDEIELALLNFLAENGRLPCPANLLLDPSDAGYGFELAIQDEFNDITNCDIDSDGMSAINIEQEDYIFQGAIPVRTLNLNDEFGWDDWNVKVEYVVQTPFVNSSATNSNASNNNRRDTSTDLRFFTFRAQTPGDDTDDGDLQIQDQDGDVVSNSAVYFLVSHGANRSHGFTRGGVALPQRNNELEAKNSIYNNDNVRVYVQYSSPSDDFDDITRFKRRREMVEDCNTLLNNICTSRWNFQP